MIYNLGITFWGWIGGGGVGWGGQLIGTCVTEWVLTFAFYSNNNYYCVCVKGSQF